MAGHAIFGPPADGGDLVEGGAHITVNLVPVYRGRLVAFDITAPEARGRWLPWTILPFGGNPYETASDLAEAWCRGAVADLRLVDVMSFSVVRGSWEIAIVFRAELTEKPPSVRDRIPVTYEPGHLDAIGAFDPVDLERWLRAGPGDANGAARLVF